MNTVLWDWNGTLLDDARTGLAVMNELLRRYHKPLLADMADYRSKFCFPVQDYYARVGLGAEVFPTASHEWMAAYARMEGDCPLREGAPEALNAFRSAGWRQVVLSASKRDNLLMQMRRFPIQDFFSDVLGLDHIYATSKAAIGLDWLRQSGSAPGSCVMIGDTLHDSEVARALGCRCVLVNGGHQDAKTLGKAGCAVADSLAEATALAIAMEE